MASLWTGNPVGQRAVHHQIRQHASLSANRSAPAFTIWARCPRSAQPTNNPIDSSARTSGFATRTTRSPARASSIVIAAMDSSGCSRCIHPATAATPDPSLGLLVEAITRPSASTSAISRKTWVRSTTRSKTRREQLLWPEDQAAQGFPQKWHRRAGSWCRPQPACVSSTALNCFTHDSTATRFSATSSLRCAYLLAFVNGLHQRRDPVHRPAVTSANPTTSAVSRVGIELTLRYARMVCNTKMTHTLPKTSRAPSHVTGDLFTSNRAHGRMSLLESQMAVLTSTPPTQNHIASTRHDQQGGE